MSENAQEPSAATADERRKRQASGGWVCGPLVGLCSALLAGLLVWGVVEAIHPVFSTTEGMDQFGFLPVAVQARMDRNNAMFILALLGAVVGVGLGIGEGFSRRSWTTLLAAGAICALAGGAFGLAGGYLGQRIFEAAKSHHDLSDLAKSMAVFAAMFMSVGAGLGLGAGLALGRAPSTIAKGVIAGLAAGLLAAIIYPTAIAALLPDAMTSVLIPVEPVDRLLWFGLAAGFLGAVIPALTRGQISAHPPTETIAGG